MGGRSLVPLLSSPLLRTVSDEAADANLCVALQIRREGEGGEKGEGSGGEPRLWCRMWKKKRKKKTPRSTLCRAHRRIRQWHVPGWFAGFGASHAVFPSFFSRPQRPGILVCMDEKDSNAVAAPVFVYINNTCYAGFACCDAPRTVFLTVDDWPLMLGIIAGMDQKERYVAVLLFTCPLCATTGAVVFGVQKTADFCSSSSSTRSSTSLSYCRGRFSWSSLFG